jgi:ABC-type Zn uptake system ZnuABC Zn-binding protein ZnuA
MSDCRRAATIVGGIVFVVVIVGHGIDWHTWQLMAKSPLTMAKATMT